MKIGIDLDGVVANFARAFAKVATSLGYVGVTDEPTNYHFLDQLTQAQADRVHAETENIPNWWLTLQAYRDSVNAIAIHRALHPADEVYYVTNRRTACLGMSLLEQSQRWLNQCGIGGLNTVVVVVPPDEFKTRVYKVLDIPVFLDDNLTIIKQAAKGQRGYLLARPWNVEGRGDIRVVEGVKQFLEEAT